MKKEKTHFMQSVLLLGASVLLGVMFSSVPGMAEEHSAPVVVNFDIPTFLNVDIENPVIVINTLAPEEFSQDLGWPHTGAGSVDVTSNILCVLRAPMEGSLKHSSGSPFVPVRATIQILGVNTSYSGMDGGVSYTYLNFEPGAHIGETTLTVSVQQDWTAMSFPAGLYTGTITLEIFPL